MCLFYHFNFERNYDGLKSKSPSFFLNKNVTFIKTRRNRNWKIPHTILERQTLCFSWYKNRELKVKLWWVGGHERKKSTFLVTFILFKGHFFNICVLPQCLVYCIYFYISKVIHTLLLLVLKSSKVFNVSLSNTFIYHLNKLVFMGVSCFLCFIFLDDRNILSCYCMIYSFIKGFVVAIMPISIM